MHIISRKKLKEAARRYSDVEVGLDVWYRTAKRAKWRNLADVRQTYPSADAVGKFTIFNIRGNNYRLVTEINYGYGRVYIRHVLTHAEYDRGAWKR